jgi:hypothetical protein
VCAVVEPNTSVAAIVPDGKRPGTKRGDTPPIFRSPPSQKT